jgi:hypothetical protein
MINVTALKHDGYERRLVTLREGVSSSWPPGLTLQVREQRVSQSDAVARLDSVLKLFEEVRDAELALKMKRVSLDAALPAAHTFSSALEQGLIAWFGKGHPDRARFGLSLGLRNPPSSKTKVLAQAKALATRKLRYTLGKRQRLALGPKGPVILLGPDGKAIELKRT